MVVCGAMNFHGIIIGVSTFFIIGLFHPLVIKGEYHFGTKIWPVFLVCGIGLVAGSLFVGNYMVSAIMSVAGFSCFWSIHELYAQEARVKRGWFPQKHHKHVRCHKKTDKTQEGDTEELKPCKTP